MIIFVLNQKIIGYMSNENLTEERKQEILTTNPFAILVDEEISYPDSTKQYEMYYIDGTIVYEEVETIEQEPTEEEILQSEMLLNQMEIMAVQQEHDMILSEILLNQMERLINE